MGGGAPIWNDGANMPKEPTRRQLAPQCLTNPVTTLITRLLRLETSAGDCPRCERPLPASSVCDALLPGRGPQAGAHHFGPDFSASVTGWICLIVWGGCWTCVRVRNRPVFVCAGSSRFFSFATSSASTNGSADRQRSKPYRSAEPRAAKRRKQVGCAAEERLQGKGSPELS
jgi:hypothetical protein